MSDSSSVLSIQFGVSVSNPLGVDGYSTAPYSVGSYANFFDIAASAIPSQLLATIQLESLLRSQYTLTFDTTKKISSQATVAPNEDNGNHAQALFVLSHTRAQAVQYRHEISRTSPLRNSFYIKINRSRAIRTQIRVIKYQESYTKNQVYIQTPFFTIHSGQGYCLENWPSVVWPFTSMYGSKSFLQTNFVLRNTGTLSTQFVVSVVKKDMCCAQYEASPVAIGSLNTSFYMPCVDEISNGRPQTNFQFDVLRTGKFHNEVRWRPF